MRECEASLLKRWNCWGKQHLTQTNYNAHWTQWHGQDDAKGFLKVNTRYDGVDVVEGGWKRGDTFYGLKGNYKAVI